MHLVVLKCVSLEANMPRMRVSCWRTFLHLSRWDTSCVLSRNTDWNASFCICDPLEETTRFRASLWLIGTAASHLFFGHQSVLCQTYPNLSPSLEPNSCIPYPSPLSETTPLFLSPGDWFPLLCEKKPCYLIYFLCDISVSQVYFLLLRTEFFG